MSFYLKKIILEEINICAEICLELCLTKLTKNHQNVEPKIIQPVKDYNFFLQMQISHAI